jgi:YebC/PmpR family DNA-binding regulatory protein
MHNTNNLISIITPLCVEILNMSGHSKWSTIKRKKGALDAKRGKMFTRLGREITVAAREGGGHPESNNRLRLAIEKAKASNMPKDNIERAIARGTGGGDDGIQMEEVTYEGYGPHGVAILVDVLTDNKNRSLSGLRQAFTRSGGNLAEPGSVAWQFDRKGYIEVQAEGVDPDELFMAAADAGADDVIPGDEVIEVYTPRELLGAVEHKLVEGGYKVSDSSLTWIAKNELELETGHSVQVMNLIEKLEELDDVQAVASTLHITDEIAQAFETAVSK